MKPIFLALLHNVKIAETLGSGDKISDDLRITNDRSKVSDLLKQPYRQPIGELEVSALLSGTPVVFAEQDIPSELTPQQQLLARLYEVQSFLMSTWIIQDNAINCEIGFLLYTQHGVPTASSNFIAHLYSTAKGEKSIVTLSREQLREMRQLYRQAFLPPDHPFLIPNSQFTSAHPRVSRAMLLVNLARGTSDIAMKVAHYCTAFETLFTTSQTELAHQLSERVACYLCADPQERLTMYRRLKAAYNLRSKVVHGSTLREERLADATDLSLFCDETMRKVFRRLLTEEKSRLLFEEGPESFDDAMLRCIFGGRK